MDWVIIFITYGILFLGELGDKTQLIVFNLTLEYEKSYKVGIGATLGFASIVSLGVIFGAVITQFIDLSIITLLSGFLFFVIGVLELPKIKKISKERKNKKNDNDTNIESTSGKNNSKKNETSKLTKLKKNAYLAAFFFIFIMELGDKTQILTVTLTSVYSSPVEVWIGSFLALITLAWMGVFLGAIIAKKVPKLYLAVISAIIFIGIGGITIITYFV
ncbi:MAG: TMEM165/GDT1 family protein [Promethearchaeota archaeon]|jgi:putative Ca2+/H+ antiporter (TMEM165/GDT1 family)